MNLRRVETDKYVLIFQVDGTVIVEDHDGQFIGAFDDFDTLLDTGLGE